MEEQRAVAIANIERKVKSPLVVGDPAAVCPPLAAELAAHEKELLEGEESEPPEASIAMNLDPPDPLPVPTGMDIEVGEETRAKGGERSAKAGSSAGGGSSSAVIDSAAAAPPTLGEDEPKAVDQLAEALQTLSKESSVTLEHVVHPPVFATCPPGATDAALNEIRQEQQTFTEQLREQETVSPLDAFDALVRADGIDIPLDDPRRFREADERATQNRPPWKKCTQQQKQYWYPDLCA